MKNDPLAFALSLNAAHLERIRSPHPTDQENTMSDFTDLIDLLDFGLIMKWRRPERLRARHYQDEAARVAFRVGYSDGFFRRERTPGELAVNPYSAGYWEAAADRDA